MILPFNMGTGDYIINGLLSTTGIDLAQITTNPGDATTLWVSGAQQQLILGDYNILPKSQSDSGSWLRLVVIMPPILVLAYFVLLWLIALLMLYKMCNCWGYQLMEMY